VEGVSVEAVLVVLIVFFLGFVFSRVDLFPAFGVYEGSIIVDEGGGGETSQHPDV